jgi:hypothetical protein
VSGLAPHSPPEVEAIWETDAVESIGVAYVAALAAKDYEQLRQLLAREIDFRSLTPNRTWEASDSDTVISEILQQWFEESDEIRSLESIQTDIVGDRERVGYRFAVRNPEGDFLVEQQAYFSTRDGQINWMRVMCSGFQPVA